MPTISFTVSTANATLLRAALAHHQGKNAGVVSNDDVREFAASHLRAIVQKYRQAQRDAENPVNTNDPLG